MRMNRNKYNAIAEYIEKAESVLITSHIDPDGDSLGSELALWKYAIDLGKKVAVVNQGLIPGKYLFLPYVDRITDIENYQGDSKFDLAIFVECPSPERAGRVADLIGGSARVINIDHHPDNSGFGDLALIDCKAAAVGEMITEFLLEIGYEISGESASLLFTAILTDTGRFRYNSTTGRTMNIAGRLIEFGADPRKISDSVYYSMSEPTMRLLAQVFLRMRCFEDGRICLISLDRETLGNGNGDIDTEGIAEYTLFMKNSRVGALLREVDNKSTKVSLRSRDSINVSSLAHRYGGGGHINASGYTIHMPLAAAEENLLQDLKEIINGTV